MGRFLRYAVVLGFLMFGISACLDRPVQNESLLIATVTSRAAADLAEDLLPTKAPTAAVAFAPATATPTPAPGGQPYWEKLLASLPSPDGKWTAEVYGRTYSTLKVVDENRNTAWETSQYFSGRAASFHPYRWSEDGRYLYFTVQLAAEGYVPFNDGVGLQRLDLKGDNVEEIVPVGDFEPSQCCPNWSAFSLSPDGKFLAYFTVNRRRLIMILRNISTGSEKQLWLAGYSGAGSLTWSPDGTWLALAMTKGDQWEDTLFTISRIRLNDLTQRVIIKDDPRYLDPVGWLGLSEILVKERLGGYYTLNVLSRALTPGAPPTLAP